MKVITAKVELTHNGEKITLKGTEAQTALQRLTAWDGQGSVAINYTDPATKQVQGIFMCCGDTWKRLPNEVEEKEEMPCKWCQPCNIGDEEVSVGPVRLEYTPDGRTVAIPITPDNNDVVHIAPDHL